METSRIFKTLDIKSGHWQTTVKYESKTKQLSRAKQDYSTMNAHLLFQQRLKLLFNTCQQLKSVAENNFLSLLPQYYLYPKLLEKLVLQEGESIIHSWTQTWGYISWSLGIRNMATYLGYAINPKYYFAFQ